MGYTIVGENHDFSLAASGEARTPETGTRIGEQDPGKSIPTPGRVPEAGSYCLSSAPHKS